MRAGVSFLLWLMLLPAPVYGQPATPLDAFAGSWSARWAQGVRTFPDGSMEIERWGEGSLDIEVEEDAASATWTTEVRERVSWVLEGALQGDALVLRSVGHDSSNPELAVVERLEMRVRLEGGELAGGMWLHFRGRERTSSERPIRAERTN